MRTAIKSACPVRFLQILLRVLAALVVFSASSSTAWAQSDVRQKCMDALLEVFNRNEIKGTDVKGNEKGPPARQTICESESGIPAEPPKPPICTDPKIWPDPHGSSENPGTVKEVQGFLSRPENELLKSWQAALASRSPIALARATKRPPSRKVLAAKIEHMLPRMPVAADFGEPFKIQTEMRYPQSMCEPSQPVPGQCKTVVPLQIWIYPSRPHTNHPLVVFLLNWDERKSGRVILSLSGHWYPSGMPLAEIGISETNAGTNQILGYLAVREYPIVAFSDETLYFPSNGTERFLAIAQFLEKNLLPASRYEIDALGISGGAQRLFFLFRTRLNIKSAYIAESFLPTWWDDYSVTLTHPPIPKRSTVEFHVDADVFDYSFFSSFLWADLALLGLQNHNTDIALVENEGEDARDKYGLAETTMYLLPYMSGARLETRGTDRTGSSHNFMTCHEYIPSDYIAFLEEVRSGKFPNDDLVPKASDFSGWNSGESQGGKPK